MITEELKDGEYILKAVEVPKVWRSELEGKPIIEFEGWVSTEALDRDGEIIRADGWRKASLRKVKLLLFHECWELPIGLPYWTRIKEADGIKGLYTRGRMGPQLHGLAVGELYLQGDMDAFSVGFNWFKRVFDSEADGIKKPYYEYIDQDLYEYSAVNIPANPEATIAMTRLIENSTDLADIKSIIKGIMKDAHKPSPAIKRDNYVIKQDDLKKAIEEFGDTNKKIIEFMAKWGKNTINASEYDDDIDIDLDELSRLDGDALGDAGDISIDDVEILGGTRDDAEIDVDIEGL